MDALRSALSKANQAAKERPLKAQLVHTDAFNERSLLRIQKLDQEREAETICPIRFGGRIGKVEGQSRPVESQSQVIQSEDQC